MIYSRRPARDDDELSEAITLSGSDWDAASASDAEVPEVAPEPPLPVIVEHGGANEAVFYFHPTHSSWKICTQTTAYASDPRKAAVGFSCHIHGCRPGLRAKKSGRVPDQERIRKWLMDGLEEPNTPAGSARHSSQFNLLLL